MRVHVLSATGSHDFVASVLDDTQFTRVEDPTQVGTVKVELLIATSQPVDLTCQIIFESRAGNNLAQFARCHVA